jgi:hypothetical protein
VGPRHRANNCRLHGCGITQAQTHLGWHQHRPRVPLYSGISEGRNALGPVTDPVRSEVTPEIAGQVTEQVTEQVTRLLPPLESQALSAQELMATLRLAHRPSFFIPTFSPPLPPASSSAPSPPNPTAAPKIPPHRVGPRLARPTLSLRIQARHRPPPRRHEPRTTRQRGRLRPRAR